MTKSRRVTTHHSHNSSVRIPRLTRKTVLKMLKLMSTSDEDGSDAVKDFLTTGRVGRRNALPDILSDHALTNTADLPDKLMKLTTNDYPESSTHSKNEQPCKSAEEKSGEKKLTS